MSGLSHLPPDIEEAIRSFIRRHKRRLRRAILVGLALAVALAIVATWAAFRGAARVKDWIAGKAAVSIPLQWERPLGEAALARLRSQVRFIDDPQVLEPLSRMAAPLFAGPLHQAGLFQLFVADSKEINAMALPGGFVIFNRGLLERARGPGEIQGVLAHEMAHVLERHGVLQLAQTAGAELILQQIQGNEEGLQEALLRDSAKLLASKFSRDQERAADDLAWEMLQKARINPQGMLGFFEAVKSEMAAKEPGGFALGAGLLSTHPTPQERIDHLRLKPTVLRDGEYTSYEPELKALQRQLGMLAQSREKAFP